MEARYVCDIRSWSVAHMYVKQHSYNSETIFPPPLSISLCNIISIVIIYLYLLILNWIIADQVTFIACGGFLIVTFQGFRPHPLCSWM
jgi:hypothetical protein